MCLSLIRSAACPRASPLSVLKQWRSVDRSSRRAVMSVPAARKGTDAAAGWDYDSFWVEKWGAGVEPGQMWDMGRPHHALKELLQEGRLQVKNRTVLVPGCGLGYDAVLLAEAGGQVTGLDVIPIAVEEAKAYLEKSNREKGSSVEVAYLEDDFFKHGGSYDVGYDYTFCCAIHPDMRPAWGEKWGEIVKPGGELLVIVFPIAPEKKDGPPWHIDQSTVTESLHKNFELVFEEKIPDELSEPKRAGMETFMLWKRK